MMNRIVNAFNRLLCLSKIKHSVKFSSAAERVSENNPINHNLSHVGKFYKISDEDFSGCFEYQMKKDFCRLLNVFRDKSIIVRKEVVEVIDYVRCANYSQPIVRYVLYGRVGTGKTVGMAHISHYAVSQGNWLIIHFGDLFSMLHHSPEITTNSLHEDIIDIPTMASNWLQSFLSLNARFLTKYNPKLLKRIDWNQKEYLLEGTPWTEVINFAIGRQKYASDCVGIVLREAREHATLQQFKVLGLIRGLNCLYATSRRCDINATRISASRISILKYLRRFLRNDWSNGAIVASVNMDTVYSPLPSNNHYPRHLLGDEGFKDLDPFVPVGFGDYTNEEVSNYLDFLAENHWLTVPSAKEPGGIGRREIAFLADNRPEELFNVTLEW